MLSDVMMEVIYIKDEQANQAQMLLSIRELQSFYDHKLTAASDFFIMKFALLKLNIIKKIIKLNLINIHIFSNQDQYINNHNNQMSKQHQSIYQQSFMPNNDIIQQLMSERGQAFLDKEIMKVKDEIGEEEFRQYAEEFFKNTGIDYKKFFKMELQSENISNIPKNQQKEIIQTQSKAQQNQIKSNVQEEQQDKQITEIVPIEQIQQQDHTNNSQQIQNQYEEIQKEDLGNNKFKIKYKNGDAYEGQMQNGMKNGWGDYYYQSGQKYSGFFVDDQINGYGHYYFLSGAHYEGDWSSSMKHGIGILNLSNKDCYEGYFINDDLHGKGTYKYSNGDIFEGIFRFGKREGQGKFYGADGRVQIGNWVNDVFQI